MTRLVPILIVILAGALFAALLLHKPSTEPLEHMVGRKVELKQLEPRAQIVNVFASWCVPCAAEMPLLHDLDLPIVGIAYNDSADKVTAFLQRAGNPYAKTVIDDGSAAMALGITGVPETFLIDKDSIVRWHYAGALGDTQLAELQQAVATWR